jgi:hypothetical protein
MMGLQYRVVYKKGSPNGDADALSRRPPTNSVVLVVSTIKPSWLELVENSYLSDTFVQDMIQKLVLDPLAEPHYSWWNGLLCYANHIWIGQDSALQ